jgi:hypothetical protein
MEHPQSSPTVGHSKRTPFKHHLLNALVGRENGVFYRGVGLPPGMDPSVIARVDLCAGDGQPDLLSQTSSPAILSKHRLWARQRGLNVFDIYVERNRSTYDALVDTGVVNAEGVMVLNGNSSVPDTIPKVWAARNPLFIHNDPNTMAAWPLVDDVADAMWTEFTTTLSTLGCNAGGVKRLPWEVREAWFDHVLTVVKRMSRRHDALIVRLIDDDAQFAWLLTGPATWRARYDADVAKAFTPWQRGVDTAWVGRSPDAFRDICNALFLTRSERVGR